MAPVSAEIASITVIYAPMPTDAIDALSPLDGRYARKLGAMRVIFSEAGLIRERTRVECAWLLALAQGPAGKALSKLPGDARARSHHPAPAASYDCSPRYDGAQVRRGRDAGAHARTGSDSHHGRQGAGQ